MARCYCTAFTNCNQSTRVDPLGLILKTGFENMGRRLDFNKAFRNEQARYGLSVKDEAEWMENDAAARWLIKHSRRFNQRHGLHGMEWRERKRRN
jgi:hypothetical protein